MRSFDIDELNSITWEPLTSSSGARLDGWGAWERKLKLVLEYFIMVKSNRRGMKNLGSLAFFTLKTVLSLISEFCLKIDWCLTIGEFAKCNETILGL